MIRVAYISLLCVVLMHVPAAGDDDPLLDRSRAVTAEFAAEMQAALGAAMAAGGPVGAIDVCRVSAPEIATRLSAESGAQVSRTSLRVRNTGNAALDWQKAVLEAFEAPGAAEEHFERTTDGEARFMKVIPTGALCLNCHGTVLSPDIEQALNAAYPDDSARGYFLGDVRGAFSVVWPADTQSR